MAARGDQGFPASRAGLNRDVVPWYESPGRSEKEERASRGRMTRRTSVGALPMRGRRRYAKKAKKCQESSKAGGRQESDLQANAIGAIMKGNEDYRLP